MKNKLTKAVFPVAGMGTRFLPATKASPKEMLTVVDKPLIQYAVEEAYEAGIREMIFVTGRSKRAIEDHFDMAYELETELEAAGKQALLDIVRSVQPDDMQCVYVRQARALGLGHAVLCAEHLVGDEPFAVLLADDLMRGKPGGPGVDWQALATTSHAARLRVGFYMGVRGVELIAQELQRGMPPATRAAVIQNASLPSQRQVVCQLADLHTTVVREGLGSPSVIVVGDVLQALAALQVAENKDRLQTA